MRILPLFSRQWVLRYDVMEFFRRTFEESGAADRIVMFLNLANDQFVERLLTKLPSLPQNYLAFEKECILVILTDIILLRGHAGGFLLGEIPS